VTKPEHVPSNILADISDIASGLSERESVAGVTAAGSYVACAKRHATSTSDRSYMKTKNQPTATGVLILTAIS
jgi:hypothetical protein